MSTQPDPPERTAQRTAAAGTRLPAIARYWWLTALRGLVALTLALAVAVAGRSSARLVTFLALFWMTGGLITLRFALAIRPRPGFRLGWRRPSRRSWGRRWCCFATGSPGSWTPRCSSGCWASLRCSRACCGSWAGSPPRSGWDAAGPSAGSCSAPWSSRLGALLLLTSEVDPRLLVPIVAAWGAVSGILLLAQGLRLRRFARTWRGWGGGGRRALRRRPAVQAQGAPPARRRRSSGMGPVGNPAILIDPGQHRPSGLHFRRSEGPCGPPADGPTCLVEQVATDMRGQANHEGDPQAPVQESLPVHGLPHVRQVLAHPGQHVPTIPLPRDQTTSLGLGRARCR